jgi:hypothetical protein
LDGLRTVFAALGMRAPTTPRGALLSYLARRVRLWTRGLGFRERPSSEVSWKESARADACWSAAIGLMPVAPIRGADFQSRGLLHALRCGEPRRIARFLTLGALQSAMVQGERGSRRTQRCLDKARELAKRTGDAHAEAFVRVAEGATACLTARWKHAVTACDEADRLLRDQCTGVAWELDTAHAFALWGLYFAGEIGELVRRVPPLLAEARKRGGRYVLANVNTFVHTVASLAADDPLRAEPVLQEQMRIWSREEFHVQHMPGLYSRVLIETYCGSGQAAWTTMRREYRLWKRPQLLRVQLLRMAMHEARARAAVAAAAQAEDPARFLRSAEQDARRQEREKSRWGAPSAQTVRAGIAMVHGDTVRAAALLRDAIAAFQAADMALHAATARRRLGQLLGGDEGQALIEDADSWMASQRIVNPERMTSLYVPGLPGHRSP